MQDQFFWPIFGVLFILALMALAMIRNHLAASRKIQLRSIQKEERLKAIEAGVPLPEVEEPIGNAVATSDEGFSRQLAWFRLLSLATGYFMLFAGIGIFLGFNIIDDKDLQQMAAIGFLPAFAGIGLLLFYYVSREK
ncbi:MAG: hypothetical protein DHS20C11_04960 [Lysobacteraceae bacterium]|nr:MAG: hypothetical protein DHS20C11_04960 [Xanthomonadaceae bacterium]